MASLQPSLSPIASRTKTCVELFERLNELSLQPDEQQDGTAPTAEAADGLGRFRIWAGNIGALQRFEFKSSLDYRLRDAKKIAIQIVGLLDDLAESLEDASAIVSNERANRTSSTLEIDPTQADDRDDEGLEEGEELSEIMEIFSSITETINSLFRFSIIIRNNTNRDRYAKATAASLADPIQDYFDINHVREKFPALEAKGRKWLISRLGKAITQRRQYLKYCREHNQKTSVDLVTPNFDSLPKDTEAMPMHPAIKAPTLSGMSTLSKAPSTLAQTQASTLILNSSQNVDEEAPEDSQSQTSYATSNEEDSTSSVLHVVQLEDVSKGLDHFVCPYCWQIQAITTQRAWKNHVLSDLKPYVCTYEDCDMKLFSDRHTWFSHELKDHRREWSCRFCARQPFDSIAKYQDHLSNRHPQAFTQDQLPALLEMSQHPLVKVSPSDCPFCDDWEQRLRSINPDIPLSDTLVVTQVQFKHHLGAHMEQLALFAIPRGYTEAGDADSGNAAPGSDLGLSSFDDDSPLSAKIAAAQLESCKNSLLNLIASISSSTVEEAFVTPHATGSLANLRRKIAGSFSDLTEISQNITDGQYSTAGDVKEDIDKMFTEFYLVAAKESPEYAQIKDFRTRFEKLWPDIHDEINFKTKEAQSDGDADSFYWEEASEGGLRIQDITLNEDGPGNVATRFEHVRKRVLSKEIRMADELVSECFRCGDAFSGSGRKHHCRMCGNIFDSKCTVIISGEKFDVEGPLNVCKICFDNINGNPGSSLFDNASDEDPPAEITLQEQWRQWRAKRLYVDFLNEASHLAQLGMSAITVCFKTPLVVERSFLPTDGLEEMYAYVECLDLLDLADSDWALKYFEEPSGYRHEYQFTLVDEETGHAYDLASGGTVGDSVGPSRTLLVQKDNYTAPAMVPVLGELRILTCEGAPGTLEYLEKQLHNLELDPIRICHNEPGQSEVAMASKFDIIIAEILLPKQEEFYVFTRHIRDTVNDNQNTPIIAVTARRNELARVGLFDAVLDDSSSQEDLSRIIFQLYTAVRTLAKSMEAALGQSQEHSPMSLAFDYLRSTILWWRSAEQHFHDADLPLAFERRVQVLLSILSNDLRKSVQTAQMHINHEVLHQTYVNDETMSGKPVVEIPRDRFLATEDNYAWDMEELSLVLAANMAWRNPITRQHFTRDDVFALLNHPLGGHLKTLSDEDGRPLPEGDPRREQLLESKRFRKAKLNIARLVEAIQAPVSEGGVRMQNRRWHFRVHYNCFIGSDMTTWLIENFEDIKTREEAVELGNMLMVKDELEETDKENGKEKDEGMGIFIHVEKRHPFRDGQYFYQVAAEFAKLRPENQSDWSAGRRDMNDNPNDIKAEAARGHVTTDSDVEGRELSRAPADVGIETDSPETLDASIISGTSNDPNEGQPSIRPSATATGRKLQGIYSKFGDEKTSEDTTPLNESGTEPFPVTTADPSAKRHLEGDDDLSQGHSHSPRHHARRHSLEGDRAPGPSIITSNQPLANPSVLYDRKERGPPPSTRGFDRIQPRGAGWDEPAQVQMPIVIEPAQRPVRADPLFEPEIPRRESRRDRPVSLYYTESRQDSRRDQYYETRDNERQDRPHGHERYDGSVEQRGFGIRPSYTSGGPLDPEMNQDVRIPTASTSPDKKVEVGDLKEQRLQDEVGLQPLVPGKAARIQPELSKPEGFLDDESKENSSHMHVLPGAKAEGERLGTNPDQLSEQEYSVIPASTRRRDRQTTYSATMDNADMRNRERERRAVEDKPVRDADTVADGYSDNGYGYTNPRDLVLYDLNRPAIINRRPPTVLSEIQRPVVPKSRRRVSHWQSEQLESKEDRLRSEEHKKADTITTTYHIRGDTPEFAQGRTPRAVFNPKDTTALKALKEALNKSEASALKEPAQSSPSQSADISTDLDASRFRGRTVVPSEEHRLRIVSPPRERIEEKPVKGILRQPREKFPEDPTPIREGVAPLKYAKKDGIPADARWTKISRKLVNLEALEAGKERFEAREDFVIVLRVLSREEVQAYAEATQKIRAAREDREREERRRARRERHERHKRERGERGERGEHGERPIVIGGRPSRYRYTLDREESDSEDAAYEGERDAGRERAKKGVGPAAEEFQPCLPSLAATTGPSELVFGGIRSERHRRAVSPMRAHISES